MVNRVRALDRSSRMLAVGMISPGPMLELNPLLSSLYPDMTIATELRTEEELLEGLNQGIYQMIIHWNKVSKRYQVGDRHGRADT